MAAPIVGAIDALAHRVKTRPFHVVGFSLGGNFALRLALQANDAGLPIERAVAVNPVIDPLHTMTALENGWSIYQRRFLNRWLTSLRRKQALYSHLYDLSPCWSMSSLREVTTFLVERHTSFADLYEYLDGYSVARDRLAGLDVPTRIITAEDDPVIPIDDFYEISAPDCLTIETTSYGGHCGYFSDFSMQSWVEERVAEVVAG
jgi:predicted alpha/beta-fold hydrolase